MVQAQATKQYWEGQYDALIDCARIMRIHKSEKHLIAAIETKARLIATQKLTPEDTK